MYATTDGLPVLPHLSSEFYAWLWWRCDVDGGVLDLGGDLGRIEAWIDERLAFRNPDEGKVVAVMTGDNPSDAAEARAALAGGKVVQELRLGLRAGDRDFKLTLKGATLDPARVSLPQVVDRGDDAVRDRMALFEELWAMLGALFQQFARERTSDGWEDEVLPALRSWVRARGGWDPAG